MVRAHEGACRLSVFSTYLSANPTLLCMQDNGDDVNALDRLEEVSEDERDDVVRDEEEEEGEDLLDENMGQ